MHVWASVLAALTTLIVSRVHGPIVSRIRVSTVMFCTFELAVDHNADVQYLGSIYAAFDAAVVAAGMLKQQHVSCGTKHAYIVVCPRTARPDESDELSQDHYSRGMALLGLQLQRIARDLAHNLQPLTVRVGVSCGPVAIVILGVCRRFCCIYGDTVNVAGIDPIYGSYMYYIYVFYTYLRRHRHQCSRCWPCLWIIYVFYICILYVSTATPSSMLPVLALSMPFVYSYGDKYVDRCT